MPLTTVDFPRWLLTVLVLGVYFVLKVLLIQSAVKRTITSIDNMVRGWPRSYMYVIISYDIDSKAYSRNGKYNACAYMCICGPM